MGLGQDIANVPAAEFSDSAWLDVLRAVDRTYAELVTHQERLEQQNTELESLRRSMASVLDSVSDVLIVVDRGGRIEETSASLRTLRVDGAPLAGRLLGEVVGEGSRTILEAALHEVMVSRRRLHADSLWRAAHRGHSGGRTTAPHLLNVMPHPRSYTCLGGL